MKRSQLIAALSCFLALIALLGLVLTPQSWALSGPSINIGLIFPLAGPLSSWGKAGRIGAELARDDINAAGGINGVPLKFVFYDNQSSAQQSIALAKKLTLSDKVLMILGPISSSACEVMFPVINRLGIVAVSPTSAKPGLSAKNRPWAFRNNLIIPRKIPQAIKIWKQRYNIKRAMVVYDNADAVSKAEGRIFMPKFAKALGIEVLGSITFQTKDIDFSAQVTKLKSINPDGVLLGSLDLEGANFVREARRQGYKGAFLTGVATTTPDFARLGGKAVEGAIAANEAWIGDPRPEVRSFVERYTKRFGLPPNSAAFKSYDSIMITKNAIERGGVSNKPEDLQRDRAIIRDGWAKVRNYLGVSGLTTIDKNGDGIAPPHILMVKGGRWVKIK